MTYSADFRNKVVQLYNSGTSTADLCAQFHISRSILYQWSEEAKVSNISKYAFERKNHYHLPEKRLPFRCKKDSRKIDGARLYC